MKVTDNSTFRLMQTNLNRITNDLLKLRNQGTTGLKFNVSSDDPGAIRPVLNTRTEIQETKRYLTTMGNSSDRMESTDGHLQHVENILVRVKEIAIHSVNASLNQHDLTTLADEIAELRNELLDAANAVVDGKYIFAGFQENTPPFVKNPTYDSDLYDVSNVSTWPYHYQGDHNSTQLEITSHEFLEVNLTGNEVFMGISNEIASAGYTTPYQGQSLTSGQIQPNTGGDITITPKDGVAVTIPSADLTDTDDNYAGKVSALLNQSGTGLVSTTNAATTNLGSLSLTGFDDQAGDTYDLNISSGGSTISVQLDGPAGYDYTLDGLASALANTLPTPTNLSSTGGTLANGVSYDISSGSLVLTGPNTGPNAGAEIELTETITGATASGGIGGNKTVYGTINIAPNSSTDVEIAGAGLGDLGMSATNLSGASGNIDLFSILTKTEEAIRAGNINDLTGAGGSISAQIKNLEVAANQNRTHRSTLGNRAKRVETAITHQEDAKNDLKKLLSRYQDADMIQTYNDIIQKELAFKSALSITGRASQISILDYL
ncbi:MAG: flagellar hook-associated protein 3 [Desulfotalea sp.]|nr:MAG: flagellar hook-associated protein 3 [Desulfotalea sp.]